MKIIGKYIKTGSAMIIAFLLMGSCSESFLEPKPLSFYAPENVLVDAKGLQAVLDNALTKLRDEYSDDQAPFLVFMKYSDVAMDGTTNRRAPWQDLNNQMHPDALDDPDVYTAIPYYWNDSYLIIKDCNTVITRIDDAEYPSEEAKNALLGSALFLRAFRYYSKTMGFGDVPLVLEEISEPKIDFYSTTKESIWEKMIKDLEFAATHVPEADAVRGGQVTRGACKHLLAKYYLLENRFDDAIRVTSEVIDGGVHKLNTERFGSDKDIVERDVVWDMFRIENKNLGENTEGLLTTVDRYGMEGNTEESGTMRSAGPAFGQSGMIKTPDGANGMSDTPGLEFALLEKYGRGQARVRPSGYYQRDVWNINGVIDTLDYRHKRNKTTDLSDPNSLVGNWVEMEDMVYNSPALKGTNDWYGKHIRKTSDEGVNLCNDSVRSWFAWPHYKVWIPDPDEPQPRGGPGDWYIYRLAETYLLRAEAYVWKEQWQNAADDINVVRQRTNAQYMYTAGDVQDQRIGAVLDERARELYYEEIRKAELTRISIIYARFGIPCYNGKTYSYDRISEENFYYDRIMEVHDFYNKEGVLTRTGNPFTISPYHIFWPIPSGAINSNTGGVINQNVGYYGTEKNVPPLVYEGD
ncbi:RagB/SusD family nutrient uptake outer membrane protein [Bacteroidota bacterium]